MVDAILCTNCCSIVRRFRAVSIVDDVYLFRLEDLQRALDGFWQDFGGFVGGDDERYFAGVSCLNVVNFLLEESTKWEKGLDGRPTDKNEHSDRFHVCSPYPFVVKYSHSWPEWLPDEYEVHYEKHDEKIRALPGIGLPWFPLLRGLKKLNSSQVFLNIFFLCLDIVLEDGELRVARLQRGDIVCQRGNRL